MMQHAQCQVAVELNGFEQKLLQSIDFDITSQRFLW